MFIPFFQARVSSRKPSPKFWVSSTIFGCLGNPVISHPALSQLYQRVDISAILKVWYIRFDFDTSRDTSNFITSLPEGWYLFNKTRLFGTLIFLQFLSDLHGIWQIGGPSDPIDMKNTEVWLPRQLLPWEWKNSLKQSLRSWWPEDLARKFVRHSERTLGHWFP